MPLDASDLLDTLTLIEKIKVTENCFLIMEMFSRAYSKMTTELMGDNGSLKIQAAIICINTLRVKRRLARKRKSDYQGYGKDRDPERPNYFSSHYIDSK
jgi:hypothetical protein